jgi:hypothetical protein
VPLSAIPFDTPEFYFSITDDPFFGVSEGILSDSSSFYRLLKRFVTLCSNKKALSLEKAFFILESSITIHTLRSLPDYPNCSLIVLVVLRKLKYVLVRGQPSQSEVRTSTIRISDIFGNELEIVSFVDKKFSVDLAIP